MIPHVFVSHASRDRAVAVAICGAVEAAGQKAWMAPRDVGPGELWGEAIVKAIDASGAMVIVLSASANGSRQVMREVSQAAEHGVPLVPVRIAELRPTGGLAYFLDSHQWLDAFPGPVQSHLPQLATALAEVTGREVVDPPAASPPQDEFIEVHPDQLTIDPRRRWSAWFWGLFADK